MMSFNNECLFVFLDIHLVVLVLVKVYMFLIFDIKNFHCSSNKKLVFVFDGVVFTDVNRYASVLTNNLISISSDGQRHFALIKI